MQKSFVVLLAEDDDDYVALLKATLVLAAKNASIPLNFQSVGEGVNAIKYLRGEGGFANRSVYPLPDLVLLDFKMPGANGLDVLRWVKSHEQWRKIPSIMLSGSAERRDVEAAYSLGINSYFIKPDSLDQLRELARTLLAYWFMTQRPTIEPCVQLETCRDPD
jgi:CheY-like chemotaxis protein